MAKSLVRLVSQFAFDVDLFASAVRQFERWPIGAAFQVGYTICAVSEVQDVV
jgi:hypothetical protein